MDGFIPHLHSFAALYMSVSPEDVYGCSVTMLTTNERSRILIPTSRMVSAGRLTSDRKRLAQSSPFESILRVQIGATTRLISFQLRVAFLTMVVVESKVDTGLIHHLLKAKVLQLRCSLQSVHPSCSLAELKDVVRSVSVSVLATSKVRSVLAVHTHLGVPPPHSDRYLYLRSDPMVP
jgi:hypothetical protein